MDVPGMLLGVMEFKPAEAEEIHRAHWTYVTNGMSDRRMPWVEGPTIPDHLNRYRIELITYTQSRADWVVELLTQMARYPFDNAIGFFHGHTFSVSAPGPGIWAGYVLTTPDIEHEELNAPGYEVDAIGDDPVMWLQVVGLKADEVSFAIDSGGSELPDRYLKPREYPKFVLLDCDRASVIAQSPASSKSTPDRS